MKLNIYIPKNVSEKSSLSIAKRTVTLLEQNKAKQQETSDFKLTKTVETFSFFTDHYL